MTVNVLPLDRYLRGVVPWEMPNQWSSQAYEAQAVAARSYALATLKPGSPFDLYPDNRSQMYGGVGAERRAYDIEDIAVELGGYPGRIVVSGNERVRVLLQINADDQPAIRPERARHSGDAQ